MHTPRIDPPEALPIPIANTLETALKGMELALKIRGSGHGKEVERLLLQTWKWRACAAIHAPRAD